MARRKKYSKDQLLDLFVSYVEQEGLDFTIDTFCTENKITVIQFKDLLGSVEDAEKEVWLALMVAALSTVKSDANYTGFSSRDKLLSVYFTFFENCALNEAFCKESIQHHGKVHMLPVLKKLKIPFIEFVKEAFPHAQLPASQYSDKVNEIGGNIQSEAVYAQLLFLLDFWSRDVSTDFEKTDIAIEKAVKALTELIDITPVKSLLDFGKFIWQERFQKH